MHAYNISLLLVKCPGHNMCRRGSNELDKNERRVTPSVCGVTVCSGLYKWSNVKPPLRFRPLAAAQLFPQRPFTFRRQLPAMKEWRAIRAGRCRAHNWHRAAAAVSTGRTQRRGPGRLPRGGRRRVTPVGRPAGLGRPHRITWGELGQPTRRLPRRPLEARSRLLIARFVRMGRQSAHGPCR